MRRKFPSLFDFAPGASSGASRRTLTRKHGTGTPLSAESRKKCCGLRAYAISPARSSPPTRQFRSGYSSQIGALGHVALIDLLDTELGAREVEALVRSLTYGQFV